MYEEISLHYTCKQTIFAWYFSHALTVFSECKKYISYSFILAGKAYQIARVTTHELEERLGRDTAQYVHINMCYKKLCCSSRLVIDPLNGRTLRPRATLYEGDHPNLMPQQLGEKFQSINISIRQRSISQVGLIDGKSQHSRLGTVVRSQTDYKSEDYDQPYPVEDVVVEEMQAAKPWWEQFPKRWLIVLLCFSAFLLCNMDRVSYIFCFRASIMLSCCVYAFEDIYKIMLLVL